MKNLQIFSLLLCLFYYSPTWGFNGELAELECPDDCDCHYFRVNWVTDCSDSNFSRIPYEDISSEVYILDLNDNRLEYIEPFPPNMKMRRLQLADNLLKDLRKESFVGLKYLIDADFSFNRITNVEPNAFEDSPGFITLELQGNPLTPVEGPFLAINSLLYLDISNCQLEYLNPDFFVNITSLSTLDVSKNSLKVIENTALKPLTSLETLKMNRCNLTSISDVAFEALENLKNLELSENNFVNIDWIAVLGPLVRLEHLNLRKSGITHLPENIFKHNNYLRVLQLSENILRNLDVASTLRYSDQLDSLDLSYCNLAVPLSEDAFANATKIRSLYLSGNSLFASDLLVALAPLTELQQLSLSNCDLSRLPDTFDKFKGLIELDISHNPLNDAFVKLLSPLETLEHLNMAYSNLSHLAPDSFTKMTSMRRLILSGNDLNNLEAGLFGNLTSLESLELNFCGLRRPFNATIFFNNFTYTDLTELDLAGNPLKVSSVGPLLPKQLSRLQILDLSNSNLTFLSEDAFYWTQNITKLVLANNKFGPNSDFKFLKLLPKLQELDLRYNNLTHFLTVSITFNPLVHKLKLIGNPWKCECFVAELWDWAHFEKGDLSILEGSIVTAENIKHVKSKGQKLLSCSYDHDKMPISFVMNKTAPGRRTFKNPQRVLTAAQRTWAKYVRESGCEHYTNHTRVPRSLTEEKIFRPLEPSSWAVAGIQSLMVYFTIMTILGLVIILSRKRHSNFSRVDSKDT